MIDRGNGARASKAVSACAGREALLRKALLGSTALIGITLATPALAQSTSPAGGGTITGTGTYTDDTATNGGVMVDNTVSAGVTMTGVTIDNTTGNPNGSGYKQNAAGGQSAVLYTAGTNSLRSDQNGAALFLQAGGGNLTWAIGQTDNSSTTDLNATFGAYLVATGFINVVDFGTVSSLRNVTGINGDTGIYATSTTSTVNLSLKAPTITGFATGINALSATGATVTTTGGTISVLPSGTGISASATGSGAGVTVSSGSAITTSVAGIGIKAASTSGSTSVTTTAGGTINGGSAGIQVNAARAGQTSIVTVGAAIGNSTRPSTGIVFDGVGVVGALNTVNANANISSGSGLYAIGSNYINTDLAVNVASGVTVSSQGSYAITAAHDITIVNNGTISATSGGGRGVSNASAPSIISVTNNGVMSAGNIVIDALGTGNVTNSGTITATNYAAISTGRGGSITNNAGATITGGSDATGGWAINFASSTFSGGQVITNNGTITGGGAGAIRLDATAASLFNLNAGSTTTGLIRITGTGAATTNLAGTLNGNYDASAASGTQSLRLAATGSMQGATLGTGNDTFTWGGGAFSSTIDGGAGTDTFAVDLGSSTNQTVNQSTLAITNFENYNLVSGNLTLTGSRNGGNGWTVAGGNATTLYLNGALTNITGVGVTLTTSDLMFVQSGAQLSATGDAIYSSGNGNNIQNSGTIVSGAGLSSAVAIGSGTVDNYGLITYAGGVATTQGNGVLASSNQLSLSNHTGATLIGRWDGARANNGAYIVNDGLIQGDRFAGVEISGTSVVYNNGTGRIYGATGEGSGLLINSGAVQVTNAGQIVGAGPAGINNIGSGLLSLTNTGTIGSGTLDGSNNFLAGGAGYGIFSASLALYNSGTISGTLGGVRTTSAMTLTNVGTITTTGTGHGAVESGAGTATIRNSGTINAANYSGVLLQAGGTLTNAVGGTITGGNDAYFGAGVFTQGFGTINNYGTLTSSNNAGIVINGNSPTTINLFAGSSTGSISAGAGDETLAIYNGQVNASAVTQTITDPVTGATSTMTLQNAGTLAAATYGAINLGGGNDTIQLRGTGTGAQQGSFSLANANGVETITKLDGGTWAVTGAAATSGLVINANAGQLQFQGTSGIGTINANGGTVLANGSGAFGTAVVHLLSSNVQFGAAGVYANNFVLDVPAVLNGQPAVFENLFGGNAILSGSITSGSGTNAAGQAIGSSQAVTFAGIGGSLFNVTGTGNSWTGITTINSGVTVRGSTAAISGGSITNNGTLTYAQSGASTSGTVISGAGALRVESGQVTLTGFNSYTGGTTVAGGTLQVGDGSSGRITGAITVDSGGTLVFNRNDNYDFTSAISGAGNVQALGTVSLSGAITSTGTFTVDSATGGQVTLTGSRSGANASAVTLAGTGNILRVGLSGSVAGGQYVGVRLGGTGDGIDNFGSITNTGTGGDNGYGAAIAVVATSGTSTINNGSASNSSATISGQNAGINHIGSGGIVATGLLTVNNYGLITGNLYNAIENQGGSGNLTVDNKASGRIVGQGNAGGGNGIGMGGAGALTLTNAGQIVGRTNGVATGGTVNINNSGTIASGTLSGGTSGVLLAGSGVGIQAAGGTITNQSGATISGSTGIVTTVALSLGNSGTITGTVNAGLNLSGTGNTITNWGTIAGGNDMVQGNGVRFLSTATGTLNNQSGALISGGVAGVYAANSNVSVDNGGTIVGTGTGSRGVYYQLGNAVVTNQANGVIVGQGWGIQAGDTANINNAGFIGAGTLSGGTSGSFTATANGNGLVFNGGYLTNGSGATITGGNYGVASGGSTAVNINNLGTITGGNYAIYLTGTNDDTVSLYAGSTTNGAIALGDGNDTLNWYGGSFTSIDGGNGNDRFAASISASTTLDLSTITGFESHDLTGGGTLTLTGTQTPTDGGWRVSNSTLALGGTARLEMTGTGVILSDAGASLTVSAGGQLIAHDDYGVAAYAGGGVTNAGLIKSTGGFDGVITNGGTVDNQAGGRIIAAGNGVTLQAYGTTLTNAGLIAGQANGVMGSDDYQTLTNTGVIVAGTAGDNATAYWQTNANLNTGDGVRFTAGGSVTNVGGYVNGNTTGIIVGGANGVTMSGGAATIENSGTLQGNSGYGISIDTAGGVTSTITNHNGGALVGGTGAALLSGDGTVNMTNEYGSYMYGSIVSTGNGTRNFDLSGVIYGDYDASSGAGVDNVTLHAGASIVNVNLGDGDDSFTYYGGTITGMVDGGAGNDKLFADFGAGQSYNVSLSNFTGFESLGLVSGDMTLSGTSSNPGQDIYAGVGGAPAGTITFDGTSDLTGDIYVNGGSIRANTAGAFGSGTIHMIDPTATFGASGTYTNNISLEVVTPSSSNPSTLNTDSGVVATLTGAITTGTGAGVDPSQDLVIGGQGTIVLTNSANSWLGTTTINSGATLQGASDTISGSAIVNNGTLNYLQAYAGTVAQDITGNGYVYVSGLAAGNTLTFAGTNTLNGTFTVYDASNIAFSGATSTGNLQSVALAGAGSRLDVTATGSLANSNAAGVYGATVGGYDANQSVYNLGSITSTGAGSATAVYFSGENALLDNSGSITGNRTIWVDGADAQLINRAGGTITGNNDFALYLTQSGTIDNSGTIQTLGTYPAVYVAGTSAITNNAGGLITSQGTALAVYGAGSTLTNAGSIISSDDTAVYLAAGGTVTNSGTISAGSNGVGVWTSAGGTITNKSGGSITGGYSGLYLDGAAAITVNLEAGSTTDRIFSGGNGTRTITIAGTLNGGYAGGTGDDAITLDTSATVNGVLDGGTAGNNTLTLVGTGAATLGDVMNFQSATKSGSGTWTLGSSTDIATWTVTGGTLVTNGGAIADTASVALNGGTLQLTGNEAIGILTGTSNVALGTSTLALTSGTGSFTGNFNGTTGGLLIDGANFTFGGQANYTGLTEIRSGTLTLATGAQFNALSTLLVDAAGTLDLGTAQIAVGAARLDGTLAGTGTLAAHDIELNGATVNGNLAGNLLTQASGTSTLGGTADMDVLVSGGTLQLAAANRIADAATVQVNSGATLDLQAFDDTIGTLVLSGTLAGSSTLTASQYQLTGGTVNANLSAGILFNLSGNSVLNGTAAGDVAVQAGTLTLGAADRLADTASVSVSSGATLDIGGFNETVGALGLNGTLAGSGTLTAAEYQLSGATVDANLGAGTVFNLGGNSVLNGTAAGGIVVQSGALLLNGTAAGDVAVQGGTLALGAANRLADTATVVVASGATLDVGGFNETVGALGLNGTLAGTGTLTAGEYQLTGATVNANLGAGTVFNLGGSSVLNGTAAGNVSVQAGTLSLGAANRLADTATVAVASGATLDVASFSDTIGTLGLNGTLAGTGTLTAGEYQLTGATVNANLGAGTVFNLGGSSVLNGTAAGNVSVQAGTLSLGAANRLADTATVAVASGATLNIGGYNDTVGVLALNGTLAGTGTLTASQVQLNNATVNANLGAGTLFNLGGTSTLNGTTGGGVSVQAGTLVLGGSNRIVDTATLAVSAGATFDLGAYDETVSLAGLGGTLAGSGTLTAAEVQLNGATVNANIGGGSVYNLTGVSTLNGTVGAGIVTVQAGTLRLGSNERLANNANLGVASGAVFDLAGYTETIGALAGTGTLALGTGKLVLSNSSEQSFGGAITGSGVFEKQGLGRLNLAGSFANTGRFDVTAGTLAFAGSSQGSMRVQGGTLIGSGNLAGTLTIASGTFSPGGLAGTMGSTNPIGSWTVGSLVATGGSLLFDFGGTSFNFASDSIKVNGTATLSGGTVAVNALTSTANDYRFNQLYTIVQANSLTGTFANGSSFATVASNPNLKWRLRYDLVANAVVLQVQKNMEFNDGVAAGDTNTLAVANALSNSTTGNASDEWAATLNTITALNTAQRVAAFKSFSGEALANISTATISANNLFTGLLRQRIGDGSDALVGGGFAGASLADVRTTTTAGNSFASSLAGASLPGVDAAGEPSNGGIWGQVYGGYQKLLADGVHAGVENTTAGVAMGVETKLDGFTLGVAGGVAQIDSDMNSRGSTVSGNQYQLGGYASYDAGSLFVAASGSWYSGDFDSKRTLSLGTATSLATGDISSKGYSFGLTGGFRTELGNGLRLALIGSASKVHDKRDGFTERATGGLGLQVTSASRDLFTASGELRLGAQIKTGAGVAMPWVSAGVRYNSGDLDTLGAMRFAGAPTGTGSFGVAGTRIAPVLGTLGVGIDARASKNVRLGIALEGSAGENTREGRASVRVKIGF